MSLFRRSRTRRGDPRAIFGLAALAAVVAGLAGAPSALANTTMSSNWAGYAVHRPGLKFKRVSGTWRQPEAVCTPGVQSYSSTWVGLGGYRQTSRALEQIGSEVDCNALGKVVSSVWYELVPAPSHAIRMTVAPGDRLSASVAVVGQTAHLTLRDLTRHKTFRRKAHLGRVDVTSADWIVEAPSECGPGSFCRLLPLADFGSATFKRAGAMTSTGSAGSISSRKWNTTRITLAARGHHFVESSTGGAAAEASASSLSGNGRSFTVTYSATPPTTQPQVPAAQAPAATRLVRPALSFR